MFVKGVINLKTCEICCKQIIKSNQFNCKSCQAKINNKSKSNSKMHKIIYNKNSNTLTDVVNITQKYLAYKSSSTSLSNKTSLSLIRYTHKAENVHNYEWSNFKKIEQLGDFILYSNKIQIAEFFYRWVDDIKNVPRVQSFIVAHVNSYEEVHNPKPQYQTIIARPLLLVLKEDFWTGLIESYFIYFHPQCMVFNLVNFDPKTCPKSLLSAIYYAGFTMQFGHHEEVTSYMHTYAVCNIKKIMHTVKLSSVQALGIYGYALALKGYPSLSRVCYRNLFRIGHAIGITINRKDIPELDQYNRKIAHSEMIYYTNWTKLGATTYDTLPEDDGADIDTHDPKYQLSNPNLNLHNNDSERIIYSIFCSEFRKNHNQCVIVNNIICNYDSNKIEMDINELNIKTNEIYNSSKASLEYLLDLYPEYKFLLGHYILLLRMLFLTSSLSIYSKMIESLKNTSFVTIEAVIGYCSEKWEIHSNNKYLTHMWSFGPFNAAFHLIKIYPHSTKKQREAILLILKSIIDFYYEEGLDVNSMNFLILKSQFDLLKNI